MRTYPQDSRSQYSVTPRPRDLVRLAPIRALTSAHEMVSPHLSQLKETTSAQTQGMLPSLTSTKQDSIQSSESQELITAEYTNSKAFSIRNPVPKLPLLMATCVQQNHPLDTPALAPAQTKGICPGQIGRDVYSDAPALAPAQTQGIYPDQIGRDAYQDSPALAPAQTQGIYPDQIGRDAYQDAPALAPAQTQGICPDQIGRDVYSDAPALAPAQTKGICPCQIGRDVYSDAPALSPAQTKGICQDAPALAPAQTQGICQDQQVATDLIKRAAQLEQKADDALQCLDRMVQTMQRMTKIVYSIQADHCAYQVVLEHDYAPASPKTEPIQEPNLAKRCAKLCARHAIPDLVHSCLTILHNDHSFLKRPVMDERDFALRIAHLQITNTDPEQNLLDNLVGLLEPKHSANDATLLRACAARFQTSVRTRPFTLSFFKPNLGRPALASKIAALEKAALYNDIDRIHSALDAFSLAPLVQALDQPLDFLLQRNPLAQTHASLTTPWTCLVPHTVHLPRAQSLQAPTALLVPHNLNFSHAPALDTIAQALSSSALIVQIQSRQTNAFLQNQLLPKADQVFLVVSADCPLQTIKSTMAQLSVLGRVRTIMLLLPHEQLSKEQARLVSLCAFVLYANAIDPDSLAASLE